MGFGTKNNINYRTNLVKINEKKISISSKNPVLGPFLVDFSNFGGKKIFFKKSDSYGFLAPYQILEKINIITRKKGLKERQKDRQNLFYRTLPTTAGDHPKFNLSKITKLPFVSRSCYLKYCSFLFMFVFFLLLFTFCFVFAFCIK